MTGNWHGPEDEEEPPTNEANLHRRYKMLTGTLIKLICSRLSTFKLSTQVILLLGHRSSSSSVTNPSGAFKFLSPGHEEQQKKSHNFIKLKHLRNTPDLPVSSQTFPFTFLRWRGCLCSICKCFRALILNQRKI